MASPAPATEFYLTMELSIVSIVLSSLLTIFVVATWPAYPAVRNINYMGKDPGIFGFGLASARKLFVKEGAEKVAEAYRANKDEVYFVQCDDAARFVVPPKFLPELRVLPETELSHRAAVAERWQARWTGMVEVLNGRLHEDVCRGALTQNLGRLVPEFDDELQASLRDYLKGVDSTVFKSYPVFDMVRTLTTRIMARMLVGYPLCRDTNLLSILRQHPVLVAKAASELSILPRLLRPLAAPLLRSIKQLDANTRALQAILALATSAPDDPPTLLAALAPTLTDPHRLAQTLQHLSLASIDPTATAITRALLLTQTHNDHAKPLRKEARQSLNAAAGTWTLPALRRLRRLDSFLKESDRLHPQGGLFGFQRLIRRPLALSDGTALPAGRLLALPQRQMNRDPALHDSPASFDGFRFFRAAAAATEPSADLAYAGISQWGIGWGSGRQNCPGRWCAEVVAKLVLATLMVEFEVVAADDDGAVGASVAAAAASNVQELRGSPDRRAGGGGGGGGVDAVRDGDEQWERRCHVLVRKRVVDDM